MSEVARHLLHVYSSFDPGGVEIRAVQIMGMAPRTWRHTVMSMSGRTGCFAAIATDVEFQSLPAPEKTGFLGMGRAMAATIRQQKPDLVITSNWGAIETVLGARFARFRKVIHHEDGFGAEEMARIIKRRVWARRLLLPWAQAVVVPSTGMFAVARDRWKIKEERIRLCPNGVDLERFRPVQRSRETSLALGTVGGMRPEKNQALLLDTFARCQCREVSRLILVGDGPDRPALEERASKPDLAERVSFAGHTTDTSGAYENLDIFVLSSRTEQMPLVVLEAMASGLPIVSTHVGDVMDMVSEPNRPFITREGDPDLLARAIDTLAGNADLRRRIGDANRRKCEADFDRNVCYNRYVALYESVMAG
jgi:glycosyltransferase involved in cell wall biosynthesis